MELWTRETLECCKSELNLSAVLVGVPKTRTLIKIQRVKAVLMGFQR